MAEARQDRWGATGTREDSRSAMARASDDRPFKPYVYNGGDIEPPEVIAARERYRAHEAQLDALAAGEAMPDAAPGYEWYRESAEGVTS